VAGRRASRARPAPPRSQHFLESRSLAAAIVAGAALEQEALVLDLGAGTGRLTAHLARAARRVVAIELDPGLARRLEGRWANVEVVEADAASVPLPEEPFSVVANIPFHRTSDLLHHLLDDPLTPLRRADLIVEWAVAHKHAVPWPSSVNGVLWGARYEASVTRRLSRQAFAPPPSVDAGVLVFRRRSSPLVQPSLAAEYHRFVASGFRHGLGSVVSRRKLEQIGAVATTGRELDAHQWAALFRGRARPVLAARRRSSR